MSLVGRTSKRPLKPVSLIEPLEDLPGPTFVMLVEQKFGHLISMLYTWFGSIEILFVSLTEPPSAKRIALHLAIQTHLHSVLQLYLKPVIIQRWRPEPRQRSESRWPKPRGDAQSQGGAQSSAGAQSAYQSYLSRSQAPSGS